MKKIIILFILVLFCINLYSKDLSLFGIEMGTSYEEVKDIMESKGWIKNDEVLDTDHLIYVEDHRSVTYNKSDGTYATLPVNAIFLEFNGKDELYHVLIITKSVADKDILKVFNIIKNNFDCKTYKNTEKYMYFIDFSNNQLVFTKKSDYYSVTFDSPKYQSLTIYELKEKEKQDAIISDL